jgi:hypothetical protein
MAVAVLIALAVCPPALASDPAPAPSAQSPNVAVGGGMTGTSTGAVAPNSAAGGGSAPPSAAPPAAAAAPAYVAQPVVTVPVTQTLPRTKPVRHRAKHRAATAHRPPSKPMSASSERAITPRPKATTGVESAGPTTQLAGGVDLTPYFIVLAIVAAIAFAIAVLRRELPEE